MILLFNSADMLCRLTLIDGGKRYAYEWQADRTLAKNLLGFIRDKLAERGAGFDDIESIGVYKGPGSFTGLRIGLTVLNTIASTNKIAIVGASGSNWETVALDRLANGEDDKIVLPVYSSEAHTTNPRK